MFKIFKRRKKFTEEEVIQIIDAAIKEYKKESYTLEEVVELIKLNQKR